MKPSFGSTLRDVSGSGAPAATLIGDQLALRLTTKFEDALNMNDPSDDALETQVLEALRAHGPQSSV